ncbi:MAG: VOC family protein [Candidatus Dependentiae bacterium]|nr:VOC family protein [Candidatus Dependentiae bacterium]
MAIKKISLCWVTVTDIEKAKVFFKESCGLEILGDSSPGHGWLEFVGTEGGTVLGVGQARQDPQGSAGINAVITMAVDDIVATKQDMESKGVLFIGDIMEVPGHVKMATFVDPDNNTYQLVQEFKKKHSCC